MKRNLLALLTCFSVSISAQPALDPASPPAPDAAPPPFANEAPADESRWQLGFAVGHGERGNPLVLSDDFTILFDIDIGWFGDRWFFDNGDGGLTLRDADRYTLNLIGRFNSDRVFFSRTDTDFFVINTAPAGGPVTQIEVPDRDYAIELGLELLTDGDWGYLQIAANRDASDTHNGYELYLNYGRSVRRNRWVFEPSLGLSYKSRQLNDYYWGIRESEANVVFPSYEAGAGTNPHARFTLSYRLTRQWSFFAVADYERLNGSAALSPIVDEADVRAAFIGFNYRL